jgi:hypothetical protein
LSDLGGADLISGDTSHLVSRDELPELIGIIADDAEALRSDAGHRFLLTAAAAPTNPLMLEAVVEAFLNHPAAVTELGDDLLDVWLDTTRQHADLIGGIALEGSARLVLADAATSYALLDRLRRLRREVPQLNDDFAGRAVRVIGAVAERFAVPEAAELLESFLAIDDIADDAAFELGMLALRQALGTGDSEQARVLLVNARERFTDAYTEEERADAAAFGIAVDAVLAYSSGRPISDTARQDLRAAVLEIRLNLLGMPEGWRTPRLDTLTSWHQLISDLDAAQAAAVPGSWLHAGALIENMVSIYSAHRSLNLLSTAGGAAQQSSGLHTLLAPRVEHVFLAREGGLAILDQWLEELQIAPGSDDDPLTLLLCDQARELRESLAAESRPDHPKAVGPAPAALAGLVGPEIAQRIQGALEPELSQCLAAMLEAREAQTPIDEVPIIANTFRSIHEQLLAQCPHGYTGQFALDIDVLLIKLLRFMDLRLSETQKYGGDARKYLRQIPSGSPMPLEKELGNDLRDYLRGVGLRVELEVSNVGAGRVDVAWRPNDELITIELKRDWTDISWDTLATKYLPQAVSYQVSSPPLNLFMVLDLTDKPDGLASLPACVHVRTVPGPAGDPRPRTLIMLRVQGNKRDPSSL